MVVSWNRGTPTSSVLDRDFPFYTKHFWVPPLMETFIYVYVYIYMVFHMNTDSLCLATKNQKKKNATSICGRKRPTAPGPSGPSRAGGTRPPRIYMAKNGGWFIAKMVVYDTWRFLICDLCVYIYIYIYTHMYVFIIIYLFLSILFNDSWYVSWFTSVI